MNHYDYILQQQDSFTISARNPDRHLTVFGLAMNTIELRTFTHASMFTDALERQCQDFHASSLNNGDLYLERKQS